MSIVRQPNVYIVLNSTEIESTVELGSPYSGAYYPNVIQPEISENHATEIIISLYSEYDKQWQETLKMSQNARGHFDCFFKGSSTPSRDSVHERIDGGGKFKITVDKQGVIVYLTTHNLNAQTQDALDIACGAMDTLTSLTKTIGRLQRQMEEAKGRIELLEEDVGN